eukprot:scaffold3725_cov376-Prasinococcus_capsulatus_cf.AAC.3
MSERMPRGTCQPALQAGFVVCACRRPRVLRPMLARAAAAAHIGAGRCSVRGHAERYQACERPRASAATGRSSQQQRGRTALLCASLVRSEATPQGSHAQCTVV